MPKRSYISKEEKSASGFKAAKDRITLLLGGNASGDLKLKPLAVYHAETPRAMKGYSKPHLSVIWRSNKKGWITRTVFQDWFTSCFCPARRPPSPSVMMMAKLLLCPPVIMIRTQTHLYPSVAMREKQGPCSLPPSPYQPLPLRLLSLTD